MHKHAGLGLVAAWGSTAWAHGDHPHVHLSDALAHHAGAADVWLVTLALGAIAVALVWRVATARARRAAASRTDPARSDKPSV